MDPFLLQLADLCGADRTRPKWVIVPTHALGHTLGERLVLGGTPWANLRFMTPLDRALQMAAPLLVERGVEPAADEVGPAWRHSRRVPPRSCVQLDARLVIASRGATSI